MSTIKTLIFFTFLLFLSSSYGQELSKFHAFILENNDCSTCHNDENQIVAEKCLNCHIVLQSKISQKKGLHGINELLSCGDCHIEHMGKDTKLITWFDDDKKNFDHSLTGFELKGTHTTLSCETCHEPSHIFIADILEKEKRNLDRTYLGLSTDCQNCHNNVHQGTASEDCQDCHNFDKWNTINNINPHTNTSFDLTGKHNLVNCKACHSTLLFNQKNSDCSNCHTDIHNCKFGADCSICHETSGWENRQKISNIHSIGNFPLQGTHKILDCVECHSGQSFEQYGLTQQECIGCHQADYNSTTNPNHKLLNFSTDCLECHDFQGNNWNGIQFTHTVGFPLQNSHAQVECSSCHTNNVIPTDCYFCHQNNYNSTTDPNHSLGGFPQECQMCHSTSSFSPSSFDHNSASFQLSGAHLSAQCSDCHQNNQFAGTPNTCWDCHQANYLATTSPSHSINNFDQDCSICHNTNAFVPSDFDHTNTSFTLKGAHTATDCISCHTQDYSALPTDCYFCHQNDYNATTDPNHSLGGFPQECQMCHTTTSFSPSSFDHNSASFQLSGAHLSAQCSDCHQNNQFTGIPNTCWDCHQSDYLASTSPNHSLNNFDQDCSICHNTNAFVPSNFDHNNTAFALTGAHTATDCINCHTQDYSALPTDCYFCHQNDYNSTTDPNHSLGGFPQECQMCHSTTSFSPSSFDHNSAAFQLSGAHLSAQCSDCHQNNQFAGTPNTCWDCHQTNYLATTSPNHSLNNFDQDCSLCHNTNAFVPSDLDHNNTAFTLTGAHTATDCISCHTQDYSALPTDCYFCHQNDYNLTTDPNHSVGGFPQECQMCHSTTSFSPSSFDHNSASFQLSGAHLSAQCFDCHQNNQFAGTPNTCWDCHQANYLATTSPSHSINNFDQDCSICHNTNAFVPSDFDHTNTSFTLKGAHTATDCISCHTQDYSALPTDCYFCHQNDYNATTDPNHSLGGFPQECQMCHTTTSFSPSSFDHNSASFQLSGAHLSAQCSDCHQNNQFAGTPNTCWDCHQTNYLATTSPNHSLNNFDQDCSLCHNTNAFVPSDLDHNNTAFTLTGAHTATDCISCHTQDYSALPTDCYFCHQNDYNATTDPNHSLGGFPQECQMCHTTTSFSPSSFDHNSASFQLSGAHLSAQCSDCHQNNQFTGIPNTCWDCHQSDYLASTSPNHSLNNFDQDCSICHNTNAFVPSDFDHTNTSFTLKGAHTATDCISCHTQDYSALPTDCYFCHQNDYNLTTDPNHSVGGFPQECQMCHSTTSFSPSSFNHSSTAFPLTGSHTSAQCSQCHSSGYANTPTDCYFCHSSDYNSTTSPNHAAAQFPQSCKTCHNTSSWHQTTWNHDSQYFPIYSGKHREKWNSCSDCHVNPSNYSHFECINCHEHRRSEVEDDHDEVSGFVYDSDACYSCHPRGDD